MFTVNVTHVLCVVTLHSKSMQTREFTPGDECSWGGLFVLKVFKQLRLHTVIITVITELLIFLLHSAQQWSRIKSNFRFDSSFKNNNVFINEVEEPLFPAGSDSWFGCWSETLSDAVWPRNFPSSEKLCKFPSQRRTLNLLTCCEETCRFKGAAG